MSEILANAQRARFGQSSEKRSYVMKDANQVSLFNEAEAEQDPKASEPAEETFTVAAHTRKKKRTIEELTAELPVEEVVIGLICAGSGGRPCRRMRQRKHLRRLLDMNIAASCLLWRRKSLR